MGPRARPSSDCLRSMLIYYQNNRIILLFSEGI